MKVRMMVQLLVSRVQHHQRRRMKQRRVGLRRTEFKIGGRTFSSDGKRLATNFEFCTSEPLHSLMSESQSLTGSIRSLSPLTVDVGEAKMSGFGQPQSGRVTSQ